MEVLKVNQKNFKKIINKAIKSVKRGEVIVFPTDTVYGLIADATNKKAVKKLFKIKKRAISKAVPIFVKDIKMAKKFANISKKQEEFLKKVWPGKVTAVFRKKGKIKLFGTAPDTIALRIPKYKLIQDLFKKLNCPLTGTSANISGRPASARIEEVVSQFKNQPPTTFGGGGLPDLVLDSGNLKKALPSTIVDLTKRKPKILRKGAFKI